MAVIRSASFPEFPRVCQKSQRGSKTSIEVARLWRFLRQIFRDQGAFCFQLVDFRLQRPRGGAAVGLDQAVGGLADVALDTRERRFLRGAVVFQRADARLPNVIEHGRGDSDQAARGAQGLQEPVESRLDFRAFDGFSARIATFLKAFVISIALVAALRPVAGHGVAAAIAGHIAAQGEVFGGGLLLRGGAVAVQAGLNALERLP
nr:hypothetical protein [Mesobacterium pallidum]